MQFHAIVCIVCGVALFTARAEYRFEDPRNFFGVWSGPGQERVTYARVMGYSHILYSNGMYGAKGASGLWFVLESPEYATYLCNIDDSKTYPPEKIAELEEMFGVDPMYYGAEARWAVDKAIEILTANGETAYVLGEIVKGDDGVILV